MKDDSGCLTIISLFIIIGNIISLATWPYRYKSDFCDYVELYALNNNAINNSIYEVYAKYYENNSNILINKNATLEKLGSFQDIRNIWYWFFNGFIILISNICVCLDFSGIGFHFLFLISNVIGALMLSINFPTVCIAHLFFKSVVQGGGKYFKRVNSLFNTCLAFQFFSLAWNFILGFCAIFCYSKSSYNNLRDYLDCFYENYLKKLFECLSNCFSGFCECLYNFCSGFCDCLSNCKHLRFFEKLLL